MSGFKDIFEK